jgi:hypothetical protein
VTKTEEAAQTAPAAKKATRGRRASKKTVAAEAPPVETHVAPEVVPDPRDEISARRQEAIDLVLETLEALIEARGNDDRIFPSMIKQALKRRRPEFNESYHGYRGFAALLDDAAARGLLTITRDDKTNQNLVRLAAAER